MGGPVVPPRGLSQLWGGVQGCTPICLHGGGCRQGGRQAEAASIMRGSEMVVGTTGPHCALEGALQPPLAPRVCSALQRRGGTGCERCLRGHSVGFRWLKDMGFDSPPSNFLQILDEEVVSPSGAQDLLQRINGCRAFSGSEASTAWLWEVGGRGRWRDGVTCVHLLVACAMQLMLRAAAGGPGHCHHLERDMFGDGRARGSTGCPTWWQEAAYEPNTPGALCPHGGSWTAALAPGRGDKGTLPLLSTNLVARTAACGWEMPFASAFAPGGGSRAVQLELPMGAKALHPCRREGGGTLQSSHLGAGW